jgi:hypothetical protein
MLTTNSVTFTSSWSGGRLNPASSSLLPPTAPVSALLVRIQDIVCGQVRMLSGMQITLIVIGLLLNVLIVGLGIYLSSYLKKKAQNLATREEFKELERQTAALTKTTAQIEADIEGSQWDREKRWELKREVLFEAARRVAAAFVALQDLETILQTKLKLPHIDFATDKKDANNKWFQAKSALDESSLFVGVTCGKNMADTLDQYIRLTVTVAASVNLDNAQSYRDSLREIISLNEAIQGAIREELGISGSEQSKAPSESH